jgi:hypothetical protein
LRGAGLRHITPVLAAICDWLPEVPFTQLCISLDVVFLYCCRYCSRRCQAFGHMTCLKSVLRAQDRREPTSRFSAVLARIAGQHARTATRLRCPEAT